MDMITRPGCWIEFLSSLRDFELLPYDLPSHKWPGYFQRRPCPFCGCGATIHAAQKLGRQWMGMDVTCLAVNLQSEPLKIAVFRGNI
jgi:hypothetical protein